MSIRHPERGEENRRALATLLRQASGRGITARRIASALDMELSDLSARRRGEVVVPDAFLQRAGEGATQMPSEPTRRPGKDEPTEPATSDPKAGGAAALAPAAFVAAAALF